MLVTNPLLRRSQVLPPSEGFVDYGSLIKSKRKKYKSGSQAFGVEAFGDMSTVKIVTVVTIIILLCIFIFIFKVV